MAIRLDPKLAEAYLNRCLALYNMQKYEEAVKDCTKAIENDDEKEFNTYFRRALVYKAINDVDAALRDYSQAIDQNPRDWGSYNNRGLLYSDKGDYSKALEDFTKAIENHQASASKTELAKIYVNRANTRLKTGIPDLGLVIQLIVGDFESAYHIDSNYAPSLEGMADLLAKYNLLYGGNGPSHFYREAADLYSSQNQQNNLAGRQRSPKGLYSS